MRAKVISHGVFALSPRLNVGVIGGSYYTGATGLDLVSVHSHTSRSNTETRQKPPPKNSENRYLHLSPNVSI